MMNLLNHIRVRRHHLILNEEDVIRTLNVINKHNKIVPEMSVGNCGWADRKKWFIHFNVTEKNWEKIVRELKVVRVWGNCYIPTDTIGVIYTDD